MSNFEKFNYNNEDFYTRDTTTYLVKGTQASSTNVWTGNLPDGITGYKEGLTIDYFLPYAGTASNATLNLSNKGPIDVKAGDSNDPVTNQFPQNSVIRLTYVTISGTPVWKVGAYYSGGSVSSIGVGPGLTTSNSGDPITSSGTISLNLQDSTPENNITHYLWVDQSNNPGVLIETFNNGNSGLVPEVPSSMTGNNHLLSSKGWRTINVCDSGGTNISNATESDSTTSIKLNNATTSLSGLMSSADKTKLDGVTDKKVEQTAVSSPNQYTLWRPLVIGYSSSSSAVEGGFTPSTQTNTTYVFNTLEVQPSSGTIRAGKYSLYNGDYTTTLIPATLTGTRTVTIPDATGTLALTSDIPNVSGKIDTAGTGLSKSGTTLNHSNSVTAKTTQALYPITFDAQGHITGSGSSVTPLTTSDAVFTPTGNKVPKFRFDTQKTIELGQVIDMHYGSNTTDYDVRLSVSDGGANSGNGILSINSDPLADFIIEEGSSGNWFYQKWKSGRSECWLRHELTASNHIDTADSDNGGFKSTDVTFNDFPSGLFVNEPDIVQCYIRGRGMSIVPVCSVSPSATNIGTWYAWKQTKNTQDRAKVFYFYARGSWKS